MSLEDQDSANAYNKIQLNVYIDKMVFIGYSWRKNVKVNIFEISICPAEFGV